MTRLRKGKDAKRDLPTGSRPRSNSSGKKPKNELKSQILALGGTEEDFDLVKGSKLPTDQQADATVDPKLAGELTSFMKGLGLKRSSSPIKTPSHKDTNDSASSKPPKHKPKKQAGSSSTTKSDAKIPSKHTPAPAAPTSALDQAEPVKLPGKVSLKSGAHFLVPPTSEWYTSIAALPTAVSTMPSLTQLSDLTSRASELHQKDTTTYQTSSSSSSEASFLTKIIQSGTLSDRLSALTLLVQSSPVHNIKALENLKSMAERGKGKGGREESLKALRCITDWWVGGGAPNRKLKYFRDQPLLHANVTDAHLIVWYYEDWLKKYFFSVLQILETLCSDTLPYIRTQSLNLISILLRAKPEQEQNLLRLLVNKLGDHEKSICSRASYHLLQLLQAHPSMKSIVIREIASLIFKPTAQPVSLSNASTTTNKHIRFTDDDAKPKPKNPEKKKETGNPHARYYAAITLNQVILSATDKPVALQLIDVYFEIFKELLGDGSLLEDRKEQPLASSDKGKNEEVKKDKKGRVLVDERPKKRMKGKEVQGAAGFMEVEDSQSKLISAILTGINRALPFAKVSAEDVGLQKHIDTLFLVTHKSTFNISLQALVLIQQIAASLSSPSDPSSSSKPAQNQTTKSIVDRYYRSLYASLHDPRLPHSSKQAMYLNLLFKSIKHDNDSERVKALVRRFVQLLVSGGNGATEFVAGGLFLLGELFSSIPGLRSMINAPSKPDDEPYDPRKREPLYAHASSSPLWELTPLLHHYHPAIALHARQLLSSRPLTSSADLSLNTLSHFLDRFVYKNPKKLQNGNDGGAVGVSGARAKGSSMMQPAASGVDGTGGVKLMKGEVGDPGGLMNEESFLRRRPEDVPVDQLFFHKYFVRKHEQSKAAAKAKSTRESDDNSDEDDDESLPAQSGDDASETQGKKDDGSDEDSELDEDEVWKAMKASIPKEGDDGLEDSDIDSEPDFASDLDSSDEEDEVQVGALDSDGEGGSEAEEAGGAAENVDGSSEEDSDADALDFVEDSDAEDLIPLDDAIPEGLIEYDGSDGEEEEWGGVSDTKKRKRTDSKQSRRKKLKSLPTFASYEDYAKMIEDGPEDYI